MKQLRTIWKGALQIDSFRVPVRLHAAAADTTIHFRLLHKTDRQPVEQRLIDPNAGKKVKPENRRKGAEIDPGVYVLLDEGDLKKLEPEASRDIIIRQYVPRAALEHMWYDRPYYLSPDGNEKAYWALVRFLNSSNREAIVSWVMRKKEYVGSLYVHNDRLIIVSLRFVDEVVQPDEIQAHPRGKLNSEEVNMAEQLIGMLEKKFDPSTYRDEYHERVQKLIDAKAKGVKPRMRKLPHRNQPSSLANALKASLKNAGKKK